MAKKKPATKPDTAVDLIRDRIVELKRVPPSELMENPKNWRVHSQGQRDALRGLFNEVGIVDVAVGYETADGIRLIDGHMRREELETTETPVPVVILDVTDEEADKILATLDPITGLAEVDQGTLSSLLSDVETDSAALTDLLADLSPDDPGQTRSSGGSDSDEVNLHEQAVQLRPNREYVVVYADGVEDWDRLKALLDLPQVRRGGYRKGSMFDATGTQRVIPAQTLFAKVEKREA